MMLNLILLPLYMLVIMSLYLMKSVFPQVGNIFFVDVFLGGAFLKYGTEVVRYSGMNQENRTDPMIAVFPRVTKCTFHKFGPSGKKAAVVLSCVVVPST